MSASTLGTIPAALLSQRPSLPPDGDSASSQSRGTCCTSSPPSRCLTLGVAALRPADRVLMDPRVLPGLGGRQRSLMWGNQAGPPRKALAGTWQGRAAEQGGLSSPVCVVSTYLFIHMCILCLGHFFVSFLKSGGKYGCGGLTCDPSTWETEARGSGVQGQAWAA
jgi:hypothetical protein